VAADGLRVAIVGYGLAGRVFHGPLVAAARGMRVSAIVTANEGRQAAARRDFPDARVLARPDDLWATADPCDLVVVAAPTGAHVSIASTAIDAGLPVVVEKPLAAGASAAAALVAHAEAHGVVLVPFLNRRWDSDHLTLANLLADGRLGSVLQYESRFERWRPAPDPDSWRETARPEDGGGVLIDLGAHLVDQALLLFGPVTHVYAEVLSDRGGADDDVFIALGHAGGTRSHLWMSALAAAPGPRLRVLGDEAAYVIDHLDGQEDALRAGRRPDLPGFGEEPEARWGRLERGDRAEVVPTLPGEWRRFYEGMRACLHEGAAPPVAAADAVRGLQVLDAARESGRTHRVVRLG
jgi:predicted dehydrogenase